MTRRVVLVGPVEHEVDLGEDVGVRPRAGEFVGRLPVTADDRLAGRRRYEVVVDGWRFVATVEDGATAALRDRARRAAGATAATARLPVIARIPGRIVNVWVAPGQSIERGERLLSIEAMKMENEVRAPRAGTIERVSVDPGDRVELGAELLVLH